MKVMILAGEASGDLHGAELAVALQARRKDLILSGMGGPRMAAAGVNLIFDPTRISTIGFVEALKHFPEFKAVQRLVFGAMATDRPDIVVLIDYAGFNLTVAAEARRLGVPVVYYICPAIWAWGKGRAKKLAERCTHLASIFPFEAEMYREAGAQVTFVGHPLLDIVPSDLDREKARAALGILPDKTVVGLLPGSRAGEISSLLPAMVGAARIINDERPGTEFVLPLAPSVDQGQVDACFRGSPVRARLVQGKAHEVMAASDVLIVASGTATLEAAILGTPMVIIYKAAALTYFLGRHVLHIGHIGLPNVVAGREVVPELLQDEANPARIAAESLRLLEDAELNARMRRDLVEVKGKLGEPGAVGRAADLVLATAVAHETRQS